MQKMLIIIGLIIIVIGLAWPWIKALNLGNLPGDIVIKKQHFSFYFPIVTCIILSVVISLLLWLFRK